MRIAILNRAPSAYPGGDLLTIADTIAALGRQGIEATYVHGEWGPDDLQPFDLVQVKHCNFGWSWFNFTQTWASGKPALMSSFMRNAQLVALFKPESPATEKAYLPMSPAPGADSWEGDHLVGSPAE